MENWEAVEQYDTGNTVARQAAVKWWLQTDEIIRVRRKIPLNGKIHPFLTAIRLSSDTVTFYSLIILSLKLL